MTKALNELSSSPFFRLKNKAGLARFLNHKYSSIKELLAAPERDRYRFLRVGKRKMKRRWAQEPIGENQQMHRRVFQILSQLIRPDYVFSGTKGRSYVKNAREHQGARAILKTDIKKFYQSVLWGDVFRFFRQRLECSAVVAATLSSLCTVSAEGDPARDKRHLPTGSPVSEVLAYWTFSHMYDLIADECNRSGLRLTIYVDDIAISGNEIPHDFVQRLRKIIGSHGLRAHKTRVWVGRPASITGVIVTLHDCRLPNRRHFEIVKNRRMLARMRSNDPNRSSLLRTIIGQCFEASQLVPPLKAVGKALQSEEKRAAQDDDSTIGGPLATLEMPGRRDRRH